MDVLYKYGIKCKKSDAKSTHYLITFYNVWKQVKLIYSVRSLDSGYPLKEEAPRREDKSGCSEMLLMLHLLIWILVI